MFRPSSFSFRFNQKRRFTTAATQNLKIPTNFTGVKGNVALSLLTISSELGVAKEVREDLRLLKENFVDQEFRANLLTAAATKDSPSLLEFQHPTRVLLHELQSRKALKDIVTIARAYEQLSVTLFNEIPIKVTLAREEELPFIKRQIEQALKNAGREGNVVITPVIDSSIIGGYNFEFPNQIGDFTISSFLDEHYQEKQAKAKLVANEAKKALNADLAKLNRSNEKIQGILNKAGSTFHETFKVVQEEDPLPEEYKIGIEQTAEKYSGGDQLSSFDHSLAISEEDLENTPTVVREEEEILHRGLPPLITLCGEHFKNLDSYANNNNNEAK